MDSSVLIEVSEKEIEEGLTKGVNRTNPPEVKETKSIKDKSEEKYLNIVQDVVDNSKENLDVIREEKLELRYRLIDFCLQLLSIQMIFLIIFLSFSQELGLSDNVLSVYMTAVIVETLGSMIVMVKYAFKSDEEVKIIDILNAVVKNFQKYDDKKDDDK